MKLNYLKVAQNKQTILDEVDEGKFKIDLSDYIIHLKSFIDKNTCKNIAEELRNLKGADKSSQYSDGLGNDEADSFFDPQLESLEKVKESIFKDAIQEYANRVRAFNWAYHEHKRFRYSEMIVRRYHPNSELSYHHDDIILEVFPQWFPRRQNILTANIYFNDTSEYEGGDLHFPCVDKSFKPSVGDVVLFPSNWMFYHKVTKITSGHRYAGTLWFFYGSDRDIKKRSDHDKYFAK